MESAERSPISADLFDDYNSRLQAAALKSTRNALALPSDLAFHRSMDSELAKNLDNFSSRVLSLTNKLLTLVSTSETSKTARGKHKFKLGSQDDVVDNFHSLVVDSMDHLFERADICLDDYLGRTKPPAIVVNSNPPPQTKKNIPQGRLDPALQHASHLRKPQLSFKKKLDSGMEKEPSTTVKVHPYHYEIRHISYPSEMFRSTPPISPRPFDETPFTWVDTTSAFTVMLKALRTATEVAVDLEHHSYRTFSGFLCLLQVSTREQDWIIDTLLLREELVALNEIFTDPKIVKVLHGAESDIVWLQQDFGLYIVNLFDTYHASKVLDFPRHGLANLLEMYCDFTPDKRYQLADWRIRPLPEEMLLYARSDTHFLLYIYDNLRNALLDRAQSLAQSPQPQSQTSTSPPHDISLMKEVLSRSEGTALRTYEEEVYDAECGSGSAGWDTLAKKWNKGALLIPSVQRAVFLGVHRWRDSVAREEDESVRYILPNHHLFRLAEQPPADMAALMSALRPVPPVIRRRAKELLDVIRASVVTGSTTDKNSAKPTNELEKSEPLLEMQVDNTPSSPTRDGNESRLWGNVNSTTISTSSSSLFGATLVSQPFNVATSFSSSSTFLVGRFNKASAAHPNGGESRFQDLVAKIHSKLVIAPSALKVVVATKEEAETSADDKNQIINNSGVQAEIPYVPPSQRQTIVPTFDDSIVVVGQTRQKKRKRAKPAEERSGSAANSQEDKAEGSAKKKTKDIKTEEATATEEPFDYSAVPNILDDGPQEPESRQRKKKLKQNKGGVQEYGNFPAAPRAYRELKSGNQSHTFK